MKDKPPLPIRDRGGSFKINNPDDESPIKEMFTLSDGLLMITEKCTYRMQMADQIDPERKNPQLPPNLQQKLFDHGTKSKLLCRTLLQAKVMFRKEFQSVDINKALQLSFDALCDLVSMEETAKAFKTAEQVAIDKTQNHEKQDASITIPAVGNVRGNCKSFFQKANHFTVSLINIVRLFYPEMKHKHWGDFQGLVKGQYGEIDNFYRLMELAVPFLKLIRNTRDCLEHINLAGVETRDFELQPDGTIAPPTIEIDFRESSQKCCSISSFMEVVTQEMQICFEMIVVHMCSKNMQPFAGMPMTVGALSDDYQNSWHVRFAYGLYYPDGKFIPCG